MAFDPIIRKDQWLHLIYNVVRTWLVTATRWRTKAREIRKLILQFSCNLYFVCETTVNYLVSGSLENQCSFLFLFLFLFLESYRINVDEELFKKWVGIEFECFCTYLPPYVVVKHNPARRRRRRRRRRLLQMNWFVSYLPIHYWLWAGIYVENTCYVDPHDFFF